MPLSDEVRNLLLRYIAGETDETESAMVEGWLENDPAVFKEFEQLWDLWYAVGKSTDLFHVNIDKGWQSVQDRMRARKKTKSSHALTAVLVAAAAAAVLLLFTLLQWYRKPSSRMTVAVASASGATAPLPAAAAAKADSTVALEVTTPPRRRKRVRLPDGSVAWLNGSTHIRYLRDEKKKIRELYLSGQAFFDIRDDASAPFIVKTKHACIKVLGTRFDVVAYPADAVTEAILTGGSIVFTTDSADRKISRHIDPGQKISMDYLSGKLKISDVDTAFYASWRDGKLLFRDESFQDVARAMGHRYGVTFEFRDKALQLKKLNGYFEKESLQEALQALQLTLQFQYRLEGGKVIIFQ